MHSWIAGIPCPIFDMVLPRARLTERRLAVACADKQGHRNARQQSEAQQQHTDNRNRNSLSCAKRGFFCVK